jgi:hypothetical protein
MGDANEYWKLLEPPTKKEKASDERGTYVICGQCNKPRHSKERCHWNLDNPNNKLKDKQKIIVNGILAQPSGIRTKLHNKRGHGETNKSNSIIYLYFICNSIEHKIYDCLYKDAAHAMFKEKATTITPKKDDVAVNMVLAITTRN